MGNRDDELLYDINELKKKKSTFDSMINQKELSSEELDELFIDED